MKGNKKILILAVLVLLIAVCFTTYAIYKSSATGNGSVKAAAWVVKVNNTDIVANNTFTLGNINWGESRIGQNDTIAPGDTGTVTITIDATGSEVDVDYAITINTASLNNDQFTVTAATGSSLTGTIEYGESMTRTVTLNITWNGVDTDSANAQDISLAAQTIGIPVTVTATQNPNPAA
ncbi:MAG: hypothetical protein IKG27_00500 [Bacilli bacterium]|nr:hypothetical protein [Bacilli bacterium]